MDAREFVRGYVKTYDDSEIHQGEHAAIITDAQDWSYGFGRLLHAKLSGQEPDTMSSRQDFSDYRAWSGNFHEMELDIMVTPEIGLRARNEVNFHAMNRHMIGMWEPVTKGAWSSEDRRKE